MSKIQNRDFSKYDNMTTESLEEILRLDASAADGDATDTGLLIHIMEVLASREKSNSTGKSALEAWESFQQDYMSDLEEICEENPEGTKPIRRARPWLRRLIAAAAAVALVIFIPMTAKAVNWEKMWNAVAHWTKDTFSFVSSESVSVSEPTPEYDGEYSSLQDVLRANNRNADIVPTWIPENFTLNKIEKSASPNQEIYRAVYLNGDKEVKIRIRTYLQSDPETVEINEELLEMYEESGVQYYIFSNMDQIRAVWIIDSYQCNISGDLSIEEIKSMIDSIGKG